MDATVYRFYLLLFEQALKSSKNGLIKVRPQSDMAEKITIRFTIIQMLLVSKV